MATGSVFRLVTRPGQLQRRAQFQSTLYYFRFAQMNDRRHDLDSSLRPGANANCSLKRFIKLEPAIRITRGIFGYSANINAPSADYFGPTRADREQVRIAKWNVTTRDFLRSQIGFRN